jgi:hypothetical protein
MSSQWDLLGKLEIIVYGFFFNHAFKFMPKDGAPTVF